jgi:hypothetical protein
MAWRHYFWEFLSIFKARSPKKSHFPSRRVPSHAECRRHHVFTPRRFQFPGRAVISRSRGCGSHTHIVCLLPPRESQKQILLLSRDCRWANKWIPEEHIRRRDLTWAKQQRRADRDGCCGYLRWHPKIEDPQRPATILSRLSLAHAAVSQHTWAI